jgi:hypothetical protein
VHIRAIIAIRFFTLNIIKTFNIKCSAHLQAADYSDLYVLVKALDDYCEPYKLFLSILPGRIIQKTRKKLVNFIKNVA